MDENQEKTLEEIKMEFEKCLRDKDEYLEGWKRAKADLQNYKKDEASRLESLTKFSNEFIMKELVSVLDSFELGLTVLKSDDPARRGMELIKSQLEDVLKRHGLERIDVKKGVLFNPAFHEAIMEVDSEYDEGAIVEEIERGYTMNGKVLRPTRVKISKSKASE